MYIFTVQQVGVHCSHIMSVHSKVGDAMKNGRRLIEAEDDAWHKFYVTRYRVDGEFQEKLIRIYKRSDRDGETTITCIDDRATLATLERMWHDRD